MTKADNTHLFEKTFKGFIWIFSSKGIQVFFQIFVLIALARLLDPATFGIVSAAFVIIAFTNVITMLGVGPAIIQRIELNNRHVCTGFLTTLILNGLLGTLIFISSSVFATFFGMKELEIVLRVLSALFIIKGFGVVAESLIQRELKFKLYAIVNATSYFVFGTVGVTLAFIDFGVWALVAAHISQELFRTIFFILKRPHPKKLKIHFKELKELYYYGSGVSIAKVFNQIATQGDNLIVGRFLGAEALGLYSRAYQLMVMPADLFGEVMDKVLFPALSRIQDERERITEWYTMAITIIAIIITPLSIMFVLLAEEIVLILFGSQWLEIILPLQILSIGLLFRTSYKISDSLVRALGAAYRRVWRQAIYAVLILLSTYIGQFWGLEGVAVGVLLSLSINFLMMSQLSSKLLELNRLLIIKVHVKPLFLSIILLIIVYSSKVIIDTLEFSALLRVLILGHIFFLMLILLVFAFPRLFLDENMQNVRNRVLGKLKRLNYYHRSS